MGKKLYQQLNAILELMAKYSHITLPAVAVAITAVYTGFNIIYLDLSVCVSNGFFIMGAIYILLGMGTYIRNVGLFKAFRYTAYKFRTGAYGKHGSELRTMTFAEYSDYITSVASQRSGKLYYLYGFLFIGFSIVLALIFPVSMKDFIML